MGAAFNGAKLVLLGPAPGGVPGLLTYLRDDRPDLPWPAHWDLPGGGREGEESPETCVLRELDEEFGLVLPPARLLWRRLRPARSPGAKQSWMFGGHITPAEIAAIRFGDEGQRWEMMPLATFLAHPQAVPHFRPLAAEVAAALGQAPAPAQAPPPAPGRRG